MKDFKRKQWLCKCSQHLVNLTFVNMVMAMVIQKEFKKHFLNNKIGMKAHLNSDITDTIRHLYVTNDHEIFVRSFLNTLLGA